jgi:trehalose synthase-fused probable maltokinase
VSTENTIRLVSARIRLQERLPEFLRGQRWFGGKAQAIRAVEVMDIVPFDMPTAVAYFVLVRVRYYDEPDETYFVPLIQISAEAAIPQGAKVKTASHMELRGEHSGTIFLYDATASKPFLSSLLTSIWEDRTFRAENGEVRLIHSPVLERLAPSSDGGLMPKLMRAEQSNSSVVYGDRLVLKVFRRVEQGINPDLEIGWFLTENTAYRNVPLMAGYMEYRGDDGTRMILGILQSFVANQGDAWEFTLQEVQRYLKGIPATEVSHVPELPGRSVLALAERSIPDEWQQFFGTYLDSAQLLGRRTAELHLALSKAVGNPAFDPEPYSPLDQRAFCKGALHLLRRNLRLLRQQEPTLPADIHDEAQKVLDSGPELERRFRCFEGRDLTALRTRIHGDYHLGQVLVSGDDFVIIDFEGEPARPLADRRRKQSPLQDVAGMLRSFHYAAYAPLVGAWPSAMSLSMNTFGPWAYFWQMCVSAAFLHSYFATARSAPFVSRDPQELAAILEVHLLEKAVYELGYELNNRPAWVRIPLSGIAQLAAE